MFPRRIISEFLSIVILNKKHFNLYTKIIISIDDKEVKSTILGLPVCYTCLESVGEKAAAEMEIPGDN